MDGSANPRLELRNIIASNPKKDRTSHSRLFSNRLLEGLDKSSLTPGARGLLVAIIHDWISRNYTVIAKDAESEVLRRLKSGNKRDKTKAAKIEAARAAERAEKEAANSAVRAKVEAETSAKLAKLAAGLRQIIYGEEPTNI